MAVSWLMGVANHLLIGINGYVSFIGSFAGPCLNTVTVEYSG